MLLPVSERPIAQTHVLNREEMRTVNLQLAVRSLRDYLEKKRRDLSSGHQEALSEKKLRDRKEELDKLKALLKQSEITYPNLKSLDPGLREYLEEQRAGWNAAVLQLEGLIAKYKELDKERTDEKSDLESDLNLLKSPGIGKWCERLQELGEFEEWFAQLPSPEKDGWQEGMNKSELQKWLENLSLPSRAALVQAVLRRFQVLYRSDSDHDYLLFQETLNALDRGEAA